MNTKRFIFWAGFVIVLGLIVWGLIAAMNKPVSGPKLGEPGPVTAQDHVRGSESAPVTLIEYSDFQCPACASYYPLVERLMTEASTTVRLVYRHYPLYPLPHKNALLASQASEAASAQGKFWEMYHMLFENQTEWAESDTARSMFEGYAGKIGLDATKFKADSVSTTSLDMINAEKDAGAALGVNSTPTFFVNGKAITNPPSYDEFKSIIEAAAAPSN